MKNMIPNFIEDEFWRFNNKYLAIEEKFPTLLNNFIVAYKKIRSKARKQNIGLESAVCNYIDFFLAQKDALSVLEHRENYNIHYSEKWHDCLINAFFSLVLTEQKNHEHLFGFAYSCLHKVQWYCTSHVQGYMSKEELDNVNLECRFLLEFAVKTFKILLLIDNKSKEKYEISYLKNVCYMYLKSEFKLEPEFIDAYGLKPCITLGVSTVNLKEAKTDVYRCFIQSRELLYKGLKFYKEKQYDDAHSSLFKATSTQYLWANYFLALLHLNNSEFPLAAKFLDDCIINFPAFSNFWYHLGHISAQKIPAEDSLIYFKKAIDRKNVDFKDFYTLYFNHLLERLPETILAKPQSFVEGELKLLLLQEKISAKKLKSKPNIFIRMVDLKRISNVIMEQLLCKLSSQFESKLSELGGKITNDISLKIEAMLEKKLPPELINEIKKSKKEKPEAIKILTNADAEGNVLKEIDDNEISESELIKRKEHIQKYLIWLDCKTGKCFVFGEQFARSLNDKGHTTQSTNKSIKKRKLAIVREKFRRWITYLVMNNGRESYYSEHYRIYKDTEFGSPDQKRKFVTKLRLILADYSNDALNDYIAYEPGIELGLDVKSKAVCVVYVDKIKLNF